MAIKITIEVPDEKLQEIAEYFCDSYGIKMTPALLEKHIIDPGLIHEMTRYGWNDT